MVDELTLKNHFSGKVVLVTGNTGFKGSWLTMVLKKLDAQVIGFSDRILSSPSMYQELHLDQDVEQVIADIRDYDTLKRTILDYRPDIIFHLAAQALVRPSYKEPKTTFEINVLGMINLLESLREIRHETTVVLVTSDKVYRNDEVVYGYRETDILGGIDPYSASKGAAEICANSYINAYLSALPNIKVVIARAGNVVGGGDWATDRLVPDLVRALVNKRRLTIRSPQATRPWQHVLDPVLAYIGLAYEVDKNAKLSGEAFNFGPTVTESMTVENFVIALSAHLDACVQDIVALEEYKDPFYEAKLLALNCDKAYNLLRWKPILTCNEALKLTSDWYKSYLTKKCLREITQEQINSVFDRVW